jgi:hypothetical protein
MNLREYKKLLIEVYKAQLETGKRFAIEAVSGPGLGKSEVTYQACMEAGRQLKVDMNFISEFLSTREQPDVAGYSLPGKDTDGSLIMQRTRAPWFPRAGSAEHGFLFLDEYRQSSQDVQKPSAELLLNGAVGETKLSIKYMVVAASNREKDRSGVNKMLAFIENRRMLVSIDPDVVVWVEDYAEPYGIDPFTTAFAKAKPQLVFHDTVPEKPGPFCTPRTLVKVSHLRQRLPMQLFTEAAAGYLGEGTAAEYVSFMRVAEKLPPFEEICQRPDKCMVPDTMDAQYAAMQMLAFRVTGKTAKAVFTYLKRLGEEFQVAGLKASLRRTPVLAQSPDFRQWIKDNAELVAAANLLDTVK